MNRSLVALSVAAVAAAAAAGGYWLGAQRAASNHAVTAEAAARGADAAPAGASPEGRRILYYRNPMGLPDTSPVPKKDSMGMDYVPVYEGEDSGGAALDIFSPERLQVLGVKTEAAAARDLSRSLRAVGIIGIDERLQHTVAPRFEGWIQRLLVNTTGQAVRRGEPLMEVYSPDLVAAQQEYLVAVRGVERLKDAGPEYEASMKNLVEGSLQRLRNWDIAEEELSRLRALGRPTEALALRAPASGVVLEKPSVQGMRFAPGDVLYRIADLSSVWLLAEVFEQDLAQVRLGQAASVRVDAYPERAFRGRVTFVSPVVTPESRTAKVRIELPNPGLALKPAMYASVEIAGGGGRARVSVPDSAVIDSGTRQLVLVRRGEGRFEPREVRLGLRGEGFVEVREGLKAGEEVVVTANFLIDAESNLRAAVAGFGEPGASPPAKPGATDHAARGMVQAVDAKAGAVSISHEPIASLGWPAMSMQFKASDRALLERLKPGARVGFRFREGAPGEWVITRIEPDGAAPAAAAPAAAAGANKAR